MWGVRTSEALQAASVFESLFLGNPEWIQIVSGWLRANNKME